MKSISLLTILIFLIWDPLLAQPGKTISGKSQAKLLSFSNDTAVSGADLNAEKAAFYSDVDTGISMRPLKRSNRIALVIGNEDYLTHQKDPTTVANVKFALNDAKMFSRYASDLLGIEESNILAFYNATAKEMASGIDTAVKLAMDIGEEAEVIFYYAGQGTPDELTGYPYLLPVDVSVSDLEGAVGLFDIYDRLKAAKPGKVTLILDACFNRGGRSDKPGPEPDGMIAPFMGDIHDNFVLFSAVSGNQSALSYDQQQHGLFTYYFLKKLKETSGKATYEEMDEYLKREVSNTAVQLLQKKQEPEIKAGRNIEQSWHGWSFD